VTDWLLAAALTIIVVVVVTLSLSGEI